MFELVSIPIAIFEITVEYARPNVRLMLDRAGVVEALFNAFKSWDIKVDDIEVISEGKPSEQGVKFKLPTVRASFFVGAASSKFSRDDANWETAVDTAEMLNAGVDVLRTLGGIEVAAYKAAIALHLQPKSIKSIDLLTPFAPSRLLELENSSSRAIAAVVKWDDRRITIDGSGHLANGIFLRFEREFIGSTSYDLIAQKLRMDEQELFNVLGIEEDRS